MVNIRRDNGWTRRGCSLLWGAEALAELADPEQVRSLRQFTALTGQWPEDLPSANGDALVVSGLEGCLDVLARPDAERWLEHDLRDLILAFQEEYQGQAALIFWTPSGRNRISMPGATEEYYWKHAGGERGLHIGRLIWAGGEQDAERIVTDGSGDYDGRAWVGLHHPRIS